MFADFVRLAFFIKELAERRLLTGFLYIIFYGSFYRTVLGLVSPSTVTSSKVTVLRLFSRLFRGCFSHFYDFGSGFFDQSEFLGFWSII